MAIGAGKCPICGKESVEKVKPFCSQRCSLLDLGQWLGEGYKIEATEAEDEADFVPNSQSDKENE